MTNAIGTAWRTFWHTMTSNDRHASHDSPYRTGRHVPLSQSRHEPLTSIATSAIESRPDLTDPYEDLQLQQQSGNHRGSNGWVGSTADRSSPSRPYSPGMRSLSSQKRRSSSDQAGAGVGGPEIQMHSFQEGAPPPPPVSHSWKKIDRWLETNYEELFDNLGEGCTQNDINELEHELDCTLPLEVRESLMIHDGQERPGLPTGVLFGCMLLDCEEIVQEWKNWKTVNEQYLSGVAPLAQPLPPKASSSSSSTAAGGAAGLSQQGANPLWRQDLLDRQDSQPPGAVQKAYAHPSWIPMARDWGGNHIAIDLAPGPAGKWGQVIIFGRDYDCKYVVARSWAAFMAMVADDFCSGKVQIDEDANEMKFRPFRAQNVDPPYLEILRWRTDQRCGKRPSPASAARRSKGPAGLGLNTHANNTNNNNRSSSNKGSPYGSPAPSEDRGRSPHRFSNRGSTQSPKTQFGVSSPLARVTEEISSPVKASADDDKENVNGRESTSEDLISVATPRIPGVVETEVEAGQEDESLQHTQSQSQQQAAADVLESDELLKSQSKQQSSSALDADDEDVLGEMKNVAI